MIVKYDTKTINLSDRFAEALKELMWANMEMMKLNEPEFADCWTWGVCEIEDLAETNGIRFCYGGDNDKPDWFPPHTDVCVISIPQTGEQNGGNKPTD